MIPSIRNALLTIFAFAASASADIRLPKLLSSHMVLQRDQPIRVWGWADPDESVSAAFHSESQTTTADRLGKWSLYFKPQLAGGPFQLVISGGNRIVLDDILVGDVWFASGQSNMEMPLNGFPPSALVNNAKQEINDAANPKLRLFFVRHKASAYPLRDFEGEAAWTACTPETAAKFSAVAYFFGREVSKRQNVPIGLIDSTWGGTPGEAWVSLDGLSADPGLMPVFASNSRMIDEQADIPAMLAAEKREDEVAKAANTTLPKHQWHPDPASWNPSWLYNGMVAPALNFGIKGVIWYQGESNSPLIRAPIYQRVFSTLITDWRRQWRQGDFPFLFVQISNFRSTPAEDWPVIREAQLRTLALANTGMAVTIDIGDPDNVHPGNKQTVGVRLALAARATAYHEVIESSGPLFREAEPAGVSVRVWFDHTGDGLMAAGGDLRGFEVAGQDRQFVPAHAAIEGSSVTVSSIDVKRPMYVRYGWQNAPVVNLFNAAGLPASPFTSK